MPSASHFRAEEKAPTPAGWRVRTVVAGQHQVRIAFPPGPRRRGAGKVVEVLHPRGENPCRMNPAELVIFANPRKVIGARQPRKGETIAEQKFREYQERIKRMPKPIRDVFENPEGAELEQAVQLFEQFHGREPEEILTEQRSAAMRLEYVALGELLGLAPFVPELKIPSPAHWDDGGYPVLLLEQADIKLASNAAGTQIYAIGGDQDISDVLGDFPEVDSTKDLLNLGELAYVVYKARKSMDGFDEKEYMHSFDEPRPSLGYDQVKQELFFIGGRYTVDAPGIDH